MIRLFLLLLSFNMFSDILEREDITDVLDYENIVYDTKNPNVFTRTNKLSLIKGKPRFFCKIAFTLDTYLQQRSHGECQNNQADYDYCSCDNTHSAVVVRHDISVGKTIIDQH